MIKILDAEKPKHLDIIALDGKIKLRYERHSADCWLSSSGLRLSEEDTVRLEKAYQEYLKYFEKLLNRHGKSTKRNYCSHNWAIIGQKSFSSYYFKCLKCQKKKNASETSVFYKRYLKKKAGK